MRLLLLTCILLFPLLAGAMPPDSPADSLEVTQPAWWFGLGGTWSYGQDNRLPNPNITYRAYYNWYFNLSLESGYQIHDQWVVGLLGGWSRGVSNRTQLFVLQSTGNIQLDSSSSINQGFQAGLWGAWLPLAKNRWTMGLKGQAQYDWSSQYQFAYQQIAAGGASGISETENIYQTRDFAASIRPMAVLQVIGPLYASAEFTLLQFNSQRYDSRFEADQQPIDRTVNANFWPGTFLVNVWLRL